MQCVWSYCTSKPTKSATLATHDKLTGLYNRHFIVEQMEMQYDLFMLMALNDQYGHSVGDEVLVAFSRCIERQLRQGDIFARYGGEEFILVLPITDLKAAVQLANRLRTTITGVPMVKHPVPLSVTASFGVAQLMRGESVDDWLNRADLALYRAKAGGRNCVMEERNSGAVHP